MIMLSLRNVLIGVLILFASSCSSRMQQVNQPEVLDKNVLMKKPTVSTWSEQSTMVFNQGNLFLKSDPDKAIAAFAQAIKLEPKMEAAYYNLLHLYFDQMNVQTNQQQFKLLLEKAEKEDVISARILNLAAIYQRSLGQFKSAEKLYEKALQKDQKHLSTLANMAILQDLYLGNLTRALNYYVQYQQQLLEQGVEDHRIINWLADLNQRISKLKKDSNE